MKKLSLALVMFLALTLLAAPLCFTVMVINIAPGSGPQGTTFVLSGSGFSPDSGVTLHIQKPDGTDYPEIAASTDSSGLFEYSWQSPSNCPVGSYKYWAVDPTLQVTTKTISFTITAQTFSGTVVSQNQGFDKCEIGSTSQMQTWWNSGPYKDTNIYIGGSARACSNKGLTAAWITTVSNQGWNFIPTWVGPQAPCSNYGSRFSSDANTAYTQGQAEADKAYQVAENLGLTANGDTIIYFDMEAYDSSNASCKKAVESALSGWSGRLRELGARAGVYGSGCGSAPSGWANITNPPDDVWLAHWIYSNYNQNASVWDVACVSNSLWANHQRIRQYAGGHNETWGGTTFNIDSNVEDGHVATIHQNVAVSTSEPVPLAAEQPARPKVAFLDAAQSWLQTGHDLWSSADGQNWQNKTPDISDESTILESFFLSASHGWFVVADHSERSRLAILKTINGGDSWQRFSILSPSEAVPAAIAAVYLQFIDGQVGWLVEKLATNSNFSRGRLLRTEDGGQSWTELTIPLGEPVRFIDRSRGWIAGGATGMEFYTTLDGGRSWEKQEISRRGRSGATLFPDSPMFKNSRVGYVAVTFVDRSEQGLEWYETQDGGQSWELLTTVFIAKEIELTQKIVSYGRDRENLILALPGSAALELIHIEDQAGNFTKTSIPLPTLTDAATPAVLEMRFGADQTGWLQLQAGFCQGQKANSPEKMSLPGKELRCESRTKYVQTRDGGKHWTEWSF
jgi:photosystem II stability/assembly factor-like uncharacterized protein